MIPIRVQGKSRILATKLYFLRGVHNEHTITANLPWKLNVHHPLQIFPACTILISFLCICRCKRKDVSNVDGCVTIPWRGRLISWEILFIVHGNGFFFMVWCILCLLLHIYVCTMDVANKIMCSSYSISSHNERSEDG